MKKLFTIVLLMLSISAFSQEVRFSTINSAPRSGDFSSYVSKDGTVYRVGDQITIGMPSGNNMFNFIQEGDGFMTALTPLKPNGAGKTFTIKKIYIAGMKSSGLYIMIKTNPETIAPLLIKIENAVAEGEIVTSGMSSDAALAELKRCKDKLDLGLITQDEYDRKKLELSQYIK